MTQTTETTIDRYITIFDRAARDPAALEELRSIFAPDAPVQLTDEQEPVTGLTAIMTLYRGITGYMADSTHFWTTTVLDDGTLEYHWVQAARSTDGRLLTNSGIERASVNAEGLITNLRNQMVPPDNRL
ncbi:SnoaL-like protein [Pseudonocardia hierapolitana]|uniref:SnoaL-like protein n=1 Tax=Pseudonocardia hierapolitana TaxID=1128676 RepID=A0A561T581_9PSEU|nr:nuclear transport factor 2 family protein [Pseudonocardia hierapolitana]TWF82271.1 SnoaL-like protein [Pseudonocardia hierapolitana]